MVVPEDSGIDYVIDKLLEAIRPRAAFQSAHFSLEEVETSRLKRLLNEIATCDSEALGIYRFDSTIYRLRSTYCKSDPA